MVLESLRRRRQPLSLEHLLATYGSEIQGVAWLILRDRDAADDVVVETILAAHERGGQLRDPGAVRAWILRIAANQALSLRRRSARVVRLEVVPERGSVDFSGRSAARVALLAGIDALPPQMRAAVVLRYYADLSVEEVARALGKSPNTVKAQLQTALDRLRASLADIDQTTENPEVRHA